MPLTNNLEMSDDQRISTRMFARDPGIMAACFRRGNVADLGGRVARGAAWMIVFLVLRAVMTIGSTAVLARLLTPADFGLIGMATVAVDLAGILCALGIPAIVVQIPRLTRLDLDSAFWAAMAIGTFVTALTMAGSPVVALVFDEPALAPIVFALSTILLLDELSAIHFSLASRLLLVRQEVACQLASLVVRAGLSIALAATGYGVWSLVWGTVVGRATYCALYWWLIPYIPRWRLNGRFLRRNLRAAGSYLGSAASFSFTSSIDSAAVGRFFGATPLGLYQTAFALPEELRSRIALAIMRVSFPAFALMQSDHSAFQAGVLQSVRFLAVIVVPMGVGMAVLAEPIVRLLYGSQWLSAVPLLQLAALIGILRAFQVVLSNIYRAKGRPELEFKIGIALLPLLIILVLAGSRWGTVGVTGGVLVFSLVSLASTWFALRLIELHPLQVLRSLLPASLAASLMGAGLYFLNAVQAVPVSNGLLKLALNVTIGVLLFFLPLLVLSRKTLEEFQQVARLLGLRKPPTGLGPSARR
jgi:PST family polysaccharide transporter